MNSEPLSKVAPPKPSDLRLSPDTVVWHLGLDQIVSGTGEITNRTFAPVKDAGSSTLIFDERNVLYSKLRPYLNKVICPDSTGVATTELVPLRPDPKKLDRQYLCFYLRSPSFVSWISSKVAGAKMPRAKMDAFWQHEIPLPPLDDQKRIAYLLSKVEGLITQRKQHLQQLDDLVKSVFLTMFGDPVQNDKGWDTAALDQFCERVVDCPHSTPTYSDKPTGNYCVRSSDIVNGFLDLQKTYQVDAEIFIDRIRRYEPQIGDIVYSREGGRLGNAARIIDAEKVCLGQRMMLFKTNEETHSEFLWALLESVPFKAKLQGLVGGGAAPRVNIKDLTKISVIKPPQALQGNFADVVQKMDGARSLYRLSLTELEVLFAVVSQQAFQGSLDLSRVIAPETTAESGHEAKATEQFNGNSSDSTFELPTPADPKNLATTNGRKTILEQWLDAYAQQLGKQSLTVDVFMKLMRQKLSDLQAADDAPDVYLEISAVDYDHVKDWIFENLKSSRVNQGYDDANNRVQISLAEE